MKNIIKAAVAVFLATAVCFAGYRVYDKTVSGDIEIHDGIQIGELYLNAAQPKKNTYINASPMKDGSGGLFFDSVVTSDMSEMTASLTEFEGMIDEDGEPVTGVAEVSADGEDTEQVAIAHGTDEEQVAASAGVLTEQAAAYDGGTTEQRAESDEAATEQTKNTGYENTGDETDDNEDISVDLDPMDYVIPVENSYDDGVADADIKSEGFFDRVRNIGDGIEIRWVPVRDATGYKIFSLKYASDGSVAEKTLLGKSEETQYIIEDINVASVYHIGVKPVFEDKDVSAGLKRIDLCRPVEINRIWTNRISDGCVNLKWESSWGANCYKLSYRTEDGYFTDLDDVVSTSVNIDLESDEKYVFRVVPCFNNGFLNVRTEGAAIAYYNNMSGDVVLADHQKYSSAECYEDIEILKMRYGDIMKTDIAGYSEDGREIVDIVLGNEDSDAALLVLCELHAREYITTVVMMRIVEFYLKNYYGSIDDTGVKELLSKICIHFVVMANPDGLEISQNEVPRWKANGRGINLNQNFPYNFKVSGSYLEGTYTGKSEACSKEAQCIVRLTRDLTQNYDKFGVLSYHAMGQIVFGSYKEDDEILAMKIADMYDIVIDSTGYKDAGSLDGGAACGNYREYLIYEVGVPAITIEMGATVCPCDVSDYKTTFEKNKYVVLREAALICGWE